MKATSMMLERGTTCASHRSAHHLSVQGVEAGVELELHAEALPNGTVLSVLPGRIGPLQQAELGHDLGDQDVVLGHEAEEALFPDREGSCALHLAVQVAEGLEAAVYFAAGHQFEHQGPNGKGEGALIGRGVGCGGVEGEGGRRRGRCQKALEPE